MSRPYKGFEPEWYHGDVPERSYRSIFKWGDPWQIKPPKESLFKIMKEKFNLRDDAFKQYKEDLGLDEVKFDLPINLNEAQLKVLRDIVGADFLRTDNYARLSVAYGKTMYDVMRLRNKIVRNVPDAVVFPDTGEQIERIVAFCAKEKIPVYVYGGGSSVTRGVECVKGGISLDLRLRFNKVLSFNEIDQLVTVQAASAAPILKTPCKTRLKDSEQSAPIL